MNVSVQPKNSSLGSLKNILFHHHRPIAVASSIAAIIGAVELAEARIAGSPVNSAPSSSPKGQSSSPSSGETRTFSTNMKSKQLVNLSESKLPSRPMKLASAQPRSAKSYVAAPAELGGGGGQLQRDNSLSTFTGRVQAELGADSEGNISYGGHWTLDLYTPINAVGDISVGLSTFGGIASENVSEIRSRVLEKYSHGCPPGRISLQQHRGAEDDRVIGNFDFGVALSKLVADGTRAFVELGGIGRLDYQGFSAEPAVGLGIQHVSFDLKGRETYVELRGLAGSDHLYGGAMIEQDIAGPVGVGAAANVTVDHSFEDPNAYASVYLKVKLFEGEAHNRLSVVGGVQYTLGGGALSLPGADLGALPPGWQPRHIVSQSHRSEEGNLKFIAGLRYTF